MDTTLAANLALQSSFLEKAASSWLKGQEEKPKVTMATPGQLLTVFKLIKQEHDSRFAQVDSKIDTDVTMNSAEDDDDEEIKLEEVPLLKKLSSEMQVEPYNRVTSLVRAIRLLESLIKTCRDAQPVPEH